MDIKKLNAKVEEGMKRLGAQEPAEKKMGQSYRGWSIDIKRSPSGRYEAWITNPAGRSGRVGISALPEGALRDAKEAIDANL